MTEQGLNLTKDFSAMQTTEPLKTFRKTILGKVLVYTLDPFDPEKRIEVILYGDPNKSSDACISLWTEKECKYFLGKNAKSISRGLLIETTKRVTQEVEAEPYAQATDEELMALMKVVSVSTLHKKLKTINSEAVIFRMLSLAKENDKPASFIQLLEDKMSELQGFKSEV